MSDRSLDCWSFPGKEEGKRLTPIPRETPLIRYEGMVMVKIWYCFFL